MSATPISTACFPSPGQGGVAAAEAATRPTADRGFADGRIPDTGFAETLGQIGRAVTVTRRIVHRGEPIYNAGDSFGDLFVVNSGFYKLVRIAANGYRQIVAFKFRGDWMGLDGIAYPAYRCDAVAMDIGEVWVVPYDRVVSACVATPVLLGLLHGAMSRAIVGDRETLAAVCTMPADARVAHFLRYWVVSLVRRGLRQDHVLLPLTRAEIGNHLGMSVETVSRTMSVLADRGIIRFNDRGRRAISVPNLDALDAFIARPLAQSASLPPRIRRRPVARPQPDDASDQAVPRR